MSSSDIRLTLLKELECPVCFEYMKPPITFCQSGHNICFSCKPNLHRCPTCRQQFLQVRNLCLENISRQINYPCSNSKAGCPLVLPLNLLTVHQMECLYGDYRCPFSVISNVYCTRNCPLTDLKKHVLRDHKKTSVELYGGGKFYSHLSPLTQVSYLTKAIIVYGELFYAVWRAIDGDFYCVVMYVGPEDKASSFSYRFALTASDKVVTFSSCMMTRSYRESVDELLIPGNCIAIHFEIVEKFIVYGDKLPFELEISRIKNSSNNSGHNSDYENSSNLEGNESFHYVEQD